MSQFSDADRFPDRKSPRLKHFDYSTQAYYFVTICTGHKNCIFGRPDALGAAGIAAKECLLDIEAHFPTVKLDKYVVMPNHIHAILVLGEGSPPLSVVIGQYKSATAKRIHMWDPTVAVWQTSFHDHVIRNQADYERIWSYIEVNPTRWTEDCFFAPSFQKNRT